MTKQSKKTLGRIKEIRANYEYVCTIARDVINARMPGSQVTANVLDSTPALLDLADDLLGLLGRIVEGVNEADMNAGGECAIDGLKCWHSRDAKRVYSYIYEAAELLNGLEIN